MWANARRPRRAIPFGADHNDDDHSSQFLESCMPNLAIRLRLAWSYSYTPFKRWLFK